VSAGVPDHPRRARCSAEQRSRLNTCSMAIGRRPEVGADSLNWARAAPFLRDLAAMIFSMSRRLIVAKRLPDRFIMPQTLHSDESPHGGTMSKAHTEAANTIIERALEEGARHENQAVRWSRSMTPATVKPRSAKDAASMFRFDVALGKAWALGPRMASRARALLKRAKDNPNFFGPPATAKRKISCRDGRRLIRNEKRRDPRRAGASGGTGEKTRKPGVRGSRRRADRDAAG